MLAPGTSLRRAYYAIFPARLPESVALSLGYIFHTEAVFDREVFRRFTRFLSDYCELTGKKAICTIMTPENPLIQARMKEHGVTRAEFLDRAGEIARLAALGYHGHFFLGGNPKLPEASIREENFDEARVTEQLSAEVTWFERNGLSHNGLYSAGWWLMNAPIQRLLIRNGFSYDFSLSKSPCFHNRYSSALMRENSVLTGEPVRISVPGSDSPGLVCVQNLVGCDATPLAQDFIRHARRLLDHKEGRRLVVTNSHDTDLRPENALRNIASLMRQPNVSMVDASDLDGWVSANPIRTLRLS